METKIAKALYELLKELYQSRAAKEFVDAYEREEQVREWSSEDFDYWLKLSDSVRRKMFPDHVCDEEKHESPKREKPEVGEVYRDIFGNKYIIVAIHDSSPDGKPVKKPLVMLIYSNAKGELSSSTFFAVPLEDFMNPTFKKE